VIEWDEKEGVGGLLHIAFDTELVFAVALHRFHISPTAVSAFVLRGSGIEYKCRI
jgi:hypothetical protein